MTAPIIITVRDCIDAAQDFLSGASSSAAMRDMVRAVHASYRELLSRGEWSFLKKHGRIITRAPYTTGTIEYDHTGGTYERQLTLSDGTLPTWCEDAVIKIGDAVHQIESRKSGTVATLHAVLNPGEDVDADTEYAIYPEWYALPYDFGSFEGPWSEDAWRLGERVTLDRMMALQRYRDWSGALQCYCVARVPDLHGQWGLWLFPRADSVETVDFTYTPTQQDFRHSGVAARDYAGTVTVSGTTVTGSGTSFASSMIGRSIRIGTDSTNVPTGLDGQWPFAEERIVTAVADTTHLTVDQSADTVDSAVKYCISDVIDLDYAAYNAMLALLYARLAIQRNIKNKAEYIRLAADAVFQARAADCRDTRTRVMGRPVEPLVNLSDWPHTDLDA